MLDSSPALILYNPEITSYDDPLSKYSESASFSSFPGLCPGLAVWGLLFSRDVSGALCFLPPGQPQEPVLSVPAVTIAAGQGWNKERAVPCSSDVLPSLHVHFSDCMFFYLLTQTSGQYLIVFYQQGLGLGILKKHPRSKVGSLL